MSTFSHIDGLFMPSGCLSPEALEKYASKQLSPEEMKLLDEHLASCALCRDAAEGASQIPDFSAHSSMINERLRRRFRYMPGFSSRNPRLSHFLLPAAASVLVLVGIIAWLHYFYPEKQELAMVTDTLSTQGDDLEMHEKMASNTAEPGKGKAVTIGGVSSREGDKSADDTPDNKTAVAAGPETEKPLENVDVEKELIADADMEEAYEEETITEEKHVEAMEMREKEVAGVTEQDNTVAKKSATSTRQMKSTDEVFTTIETEPEYPGGMDSLLVFLSKNLNYPKEVDHKIDTTVIASFIVSKKGKIKDIEIVRSAGKVFDDEVVRVIKFMPDWIPAQQRGKPVAVKYNLPIRFKSE